MERYKLMKKNYLGIFYGAEGGLIRVARLCMSKLKNKVKRDGEKRFWGVSKRINRVKLYTERVILWVKRLHIVIVHFIEYPLTKVKKANSLHVIREK